MFGLLALSVGGPAATLCTKDDPAPLPRTASKGLLPAGGELVCLTGDESLMMAGMGHLEVAHVDYYLPDGRMLLNDASFRVGQGDSVALVGANGAGKSTLLRIISGELKPHAGTVTSSGGLGVMPQFIGSVRDERNVRDLLISVARPVIRDAARAVDEAELAI